MEKNIYKFNAYEASSEDLEALSEIIYQVNSNPNTRVRFRKIADDLNGNVTIAVCKA